MKLSAEKRNQLILIGLGTVGVVAGLWVGLISYQETKLKEAAAKIEKTKTEIEKMRRVEREQGQLAEDLKQAEDKLSSIEANMPNGDLYAWFLSQVKQFNAPSYKVVIPSLGAPSVSEVGMFLNFPYHQATIEISGTAYYWDLGKFVADFENRYPYGRVQNLAMEPMSGATPEEKERLNFHMDFVVLLKANNP